MAVLGVTVACALGTGCGGKYYEMGKSAELKGDPAKAYDYYCLAGAKNRNGAVAGGLARTRVDAATQSERAGLAAMDDGRYTDAWRLFMRTLEIQPDHPTAAQLVRKLENEHSNEIATARHEWMMRGAVALAAPNERVLTMVEPSKASSVPPAKSEPIGRTTVAAPAPLASEESRPSRRNDVVSVADSKPIEPDREREMVRPPPKPSRQSDRRPVASPEQSEFLATHTLSLKDRRYPRMVIAMDGIGVKLKDTDSDGEVDMDLFDGKERVQKIRDLELGRSQTFRGQSGDLYRLTLLGVHHKSRTIRIGVKRA